MNAKLPLAEMRDFALNLDPDIGPLFGRDVARLVDRCQALEEALNEEDPSRWSFQTLVEIARQLLVVHYPADVFDGSSGDPGPVFVIRLREALNGLGEAGST